MSDLFSWSRKSTLVERNLCLDTGRQKGYALHPWKDEAGLVHGGSTLLEQYRRLSGSRSNLSSLRRAERCQYRQKKDPRPSLVEVCSRAVF